MTDIVVGFFAPWMIYGAILVFHLVLPARTVAGYVRDAQTHETLHYRLNALAVLLAALALWGILARLEWLPADWLYLHRWPGLAGACTLGLIASIAMVWPAPGSGQRFFVDFYRGRLENPQFFKRRIDAKMFLYMAGATLLALNLISSFAHHVMIFGAQASPGVSLYTALFFWFLIDYVVFERVHLYTYDLFAEQVGFKLAWGCLTFYPYVYGVGLFATAELPNPHSTPLFLILCACFFFIGWGLSRGANMQKFYFKTAPQRTFLGVFRPQTISDESHALLCSGFWGVSRHVNYLGEILMATGMTLALGRPGIWAVWIYPLYYVLLLVPRERADERRCAAKYGRLWIEYVRRVPKRIIPGIY